MKKLIYTAVFTGKGGPKDPKDPTLWAARSTAPSATITTTAGPKGLQNKVEKVSGHDIVFESEAKFLTKTTLDEWGAITFGPGHTLRFSTVGEGFIGDAGVPRTTAGCIIWKVDGGTGQFEGATGYITSNFTGNPDGSMNDYQFGVLFVK
ncbi:MAG: hypothetical protein FJ317_04550 [SAR202 cluster bacterium]|nr:hypothetical protein [SAR202 cluster bacterium]